jgi:hypothetical protein
MITEAGGYGGKARNYKYVGKRVGMDGYAARVCVCVCAQSGDSTAAGCDCDVLW